MTTGKNHSFDYTDFVSEVTFLLFNMLSRLVIAFLPRSKSFNFVAAVTIRDQFPEKIKGFCLGHSLCCGALALGKGML